MTPREWRMLTALGLLLPLSWWSLALQSRGFFLDSAIVGVPGVVLVWAVCRIMRLLQERRGR